MFCAGKKMISCFLERMGRARSQIGNIIFSSTSAVESQQSMVETLVTPVFLTCQLQMQNSCSQTTTGVALKAWFVLLVFQKQQQNHINGNT